MSSETMLTIGAGSVEIGAACVYAFRFNVDPFLPGMVLGLILIATLEIRARIAKRRKGK